MLSKSVYAEIAVFSPVGYSLHYSVPDTLVKRIQIGQRVLVPLGKRNLIGGLVLSKARNIPPEVHVDPSEIRPISALIDETPVVPESMIPFIRWLSSYYFYPIGEVVRTILPAGLKVVTSMRLGITGEGLKYLEKLPGTSPEREILEMVAVTKNPTISKIVKSLNRPDCFYYIGRLRRNGYLTSLESLSVGKGRGRQVKVVKALLPSLPVADKVPERLEALWNLIVEKDGAVPLSLIYKKIPGAYYWVKKLLKLGAIKVEQREMGADLFDDVFASENDAPPVPTADQKRVISSVSEYILKPRFRVFLLHGVTGSGKTEIYSNLIKMALDKGLQVLLLVPEIALSTHLERILFLRFGEIVAVLHSALTPQERFDQWKGILEGKFKIVVGARSGVFAPVKKLGLIVVDEEQDSSYKQENTLRYHGRDAAIMRGKLEGIPVVLGSATPSLESYHNAITGKYELLGLPERIHKRPLPEVEIIDMRRQGGKATIFSKPLEEEMNEVLGRGEQVLLFLNRRGFATFLICIVCGKAIRCKRCAISLTLHKRTRRLSCHYCGYSIPIPAKCPSCGNASIKQYGFGTEKVEDHVKQLFSGYRIRRLDSDTARSRKTLQRLYRDLHNGKIQILVGTQMVAKGHDFPGITLVGVIAADVSLQLPDFRAAETTFQLLTQVAGRAGRGEKPGKVLIQTYNPRHYVFHFARVHDYDGFANKELELRKALGYPPFSRLVRIVATGKSEHKVQQVARKLVNEGVALKKAEKEYSNVSILGPAESPLSLLRNQYRWHLFIKAPQAGLVQSFIRDLVEHSVAKRRIQNVRIIVDVDPVNVL